MNRILLLCFFAICSNSIFAQVQKPANKGAKITESRKKSTKVTPDRLTEDEKKEGEIKAQEESSYRLKKWKITDPDLIEKRRKEKATRPSSSQPKLSSK